MVGQSGPEKGGDPDGKEDEQSPHGGGPFLLQMGLGAVFLDDLSNLKSGQAFDGPGTQQKTKGEGGKPPINGSEGDVPEYIKKRNIRVEWI